MVITCPFPNICHTLQVAEGLGYGDEPDVSDPLTPSHFLIGRPAGFQLEIKDDVPCNIFVDDLLSICIERMVHLSLKHLCNNIYFLP